MELGGAYQFLDVVGEGCHSHECPDRSPYGSGEGELEEGIFNSHSRWWRVQAEAAIGWRKMTVGL